MNSITRTSLDVQNLTLQTQPATRYTKTMRGRYNERHPKEVRGLYIQLYHILGGKEQIHGRWNGGSGMKTKPRALGTSGCAAPAEHKSSGSPAVLNMLGDWQHSSCFVCLFFSRYLC